MPLMDILCIKPYSNSIYTYIYIIITTRVFQLVMCGVSSVCTYTIFFFKK